MYWAIDLSSRRPLPHYGSLSPLGPSVTSTALCHLYNSLFPRLLSPLRPSVPSMVLYYLYGSLPLYSPLYPSWPSVPYAVLLFPLRPSVLSMTLCPLKRPSVPSAALFPFYNPLPPLWPSAPYNFLESVIMLILSGSLSPRGTKLNDALVWTFLLPLQEKAGFLVWSFFLRKTTLASVFLRNHGQESR
jgi:hypothetical protein